MNTVDPIKIRFEFGGVLNSPLNIPLDPGGGPYTDYTSSNQCSNRSDTSTTSLADLTAVSERVKKLYPQPTKAQKQFAEVMGFPDYPGFIFSPALEILLRRNQHLENAGIGTAAEILAVPEIPAWGFAGVAYNVDPKLAGLEYRSAEEEWRFLMERLDKETADLMDPQKSCVWTEPVIRITE